MTPNNISTERVHVRNLLIFNMIIGGPDRDRTDDLFHAMEQFKPQSTDGTVLTNRHNRQKRPTGRYLRAKCGQNTNQVANGLIVWNQPQLNLLQLSKQV